MAQCTAPYEGHRTQSGAERCPACRGSGFGYRPTRSYYTAPSYRQGSSSATSASTRSAASRRTRSGRSVSYSSTEWRQVEPFVEKAAEQASKHPDRRDLFLCHAWNDRQGSARELHSKLLSYKATVWFSEDDLPLGSLMLREIDKGLRNSRLGIVLVTPGMLKSIEGAGVAEKELSVLLATRRVIPVLHEVTFEDLNDISPMLASHSGLTTADQSMDEVAAKIAAVAAALPA